jgi:hypothetical protein
LEVPDDSARLAAESDLYRLQGELIEAVAARNTAAASVRLAVKKNDAVRAKQAVADLKKLPDAQVYLDRVTAIRVPALKLAQSRKDRAGEARIKRMCDEMTELVKQYLSEDKRQAVLEELKELVTDDDPAEKPGKEVNIRIGIPCCVRVALQKPSGLTRFNAEVTMLRPEVGVVGTLLAQSQ